LLLIQLLPILLPVVIGMRNGTFFSDNVSVVGLHVVRVVVVL